MNVELSIIVRSGYKSQFHLIRLGGGLERYLKGQSVVDMLKQEWSREL